MLNRGGAPPTASRSRDSATSSTSCASSAKELLTEGDLGGEFHEVAEELQRSSPRSATASTSSKPTPGTRATSAARR